MQHENSASHAHVILLVCQDGAIPASEKHVVLATTQCHMVVTWQAADPIARPSSWYDILPCGSQGMQSLTSVEPGSPPRVGDACQHKAGSNLIIVQERLVVLVDAALLHLACTHTLSCRRACIPPSNC